MAPGIQRRALAKGAAWSTPVIMLASAVPAFAASPGPLPPTSLGNTFIDVTATGNHQIYDNGVPTIWYWDGSNGRQFRQSSDSDVTQYLIAPGANYSTPNSAICAYSAGPATTVSGSCVLFKGDALNTTAWLGIQTKNGMTLKAGVKYTLTIPWAATGSYNKNMRLQAGFASAPYAWADTMPAVAWVASTTVTSTVGRNTSGVLSVSYTPTTTGTYYLDVFARAVAAASTATTCAGYVNDIAIGSPVITTG